MEAVHAAIANAKAAAIANAKAAAIANAKVEAGAEANAEQLDQAAAQAVEKAKAFHGHFCPGLAMGIRAAEIALREIGPHSPDEEVVAIVETDM